MRSEPEPHAALSRPVLSRPSLRRRILAAIGVACIALSTVTGIAAASAATADEILLDRQHTDAVSIRYESDALVLKTRADLESGAGQLLDPSRVRFHVTDALRDTVPDVPAFAFLGEPGSQIWKISQTYEPGVLWAGWETETLPRGTFAEDSVRLHLDDVSGPGTLEVYVNDLEGPRRIFSSSDESLRSHVESVGAHTHANWVFTKAGTYRLTFTAEAERASGGSIRSAAQTYMFTVGSEDVTPSPTSDPTPTTTPSATPSATASPTATPSPTPSPTATTSPTPAPIPTVAPTQALPAPDPATLTEGSRGGVAVGAPAVSAGSPVTVTVPAAHAGQWVSPWTLSVPTDLGWKQVNAEGSFAVAVPPDAPVGEHRLVVRDRTGSLIGWTDLEVVAAAAAVEQCIVTPVTSTTGAGTVDVVTTGHFDFGPLLEGGTLMARVKDDRSSPPPWIDPGTLIFHLGDAAAAQAPGGQFDFLGSGTVWQIPLTQQSGVPWLGWNTQHPTVAGHAQGPVTLTLDGLEGPGELAVYSVNSWGQLGSRYFGTVDGFPRSTSIEVGASGVHVHGIWAFTQPGAYYATMTFAGTIDGQQRSATTTLTFFVGSGDPQSAAREQTVTTYVGRTASGAECEPSLAATGPADVGAAIDLAGIAGASMLVGLAFLGASAIAPRRRVLTDRAVHDQ